MKEKFKLAVSIIFETSEIDKLIAYSSFFDKIKLKRIKKKLSNEDITKINFQELFHYLYSRGTSELWADIFLFVMADNLQ